MLDRDIAIVAFAILAAGCYFIAEKDNYRMNFTFAVLALWCGLWTYLDNYRFICFICVIIFVFYFFPFVKEFIKRRKK